MRKLFAPPSQVAVPTPQAPLSNEALLDHLAERSGDSGIEGVVVRGEMGLISGPARDRFVIREYWRRGVFAAPTVALIHEHLSDGGCFLDIGANIGLTTVPILKSMDVRAIAFEPEPVNHFYLVQNLHGHNLANRCDVHELAVSDREGELEFETSPFNPGDSRLKIGGEVADMGEDSWTRHRVACRRLDDLVETDASPLVIKVDVQGAEPLVVAGGARTFARADMAILEFWPYGMRRMGLSPDPVIDLVAAAEQAAFYLGDHPEETSDVDWLSGQRAASELRTRYERLSSDGSQAFFDVVIRKPR